MERLLRVKLNRGEVRQGQGIHANENGFYNAEANLPHRILLAMPGDIFDLPN